MSHTTDKWHKSDNQVLDYKNGIIANIVSDELGRDIDADTHLIAAAPDLLSALESLVATTNEYHGDVCGGGNVDNCETCCEIKSAQDVIKKASGE